MVAPTREQQREDTEVGTALATALSGLATRQASIDPAHELAGSHVRCPTAEPSAGPRDDPVKRERDTADVRPVVFGLEALPLFPPLSLCRGRGASLCIADRIVSS